jgi:hypothetical protein
VTNAPGAPVFPPGRYGHRRDPGRSRRRWLPALALVLLVLAALAIGARLYGQYGNPPYRAQLTGMEQITDSSVTVAFTVRKRDGGPARCQVQAKDHSGAEVGYAEVPVGGTGTVQVRYTLRTSARPYAVDVLGCHAG